MGKNNDQTKDEIAKKVQAHYNRYTSYRYIPKLPPQRDGKARKHNQD